MNALSILAIIGGVALFVGLYGGVKVKEIEIPPLPPWARIVSAVVGVLLLIFISLQYFPLNQASPQTPTESPTPSLMKNTPTMDTGQTPTATHIEMTPSLTSMPSPTVTGLSIGVITTNLPDGVINDVTSVKATQGCFMLYGSMYSDMDYQEICNTEIAKLEAVWNDHAKRISADCVKYPNISISLWTGNNYQGTTWTFKCP